MPSFRVPNPASIALPSLLAALSVSIGASLMRAQTPLVPAPASSIATIEAQFGGKVHPFVKAYCLPCHGTEKPEGDLDLSGFDSVEKVVAGHSYWELVLERLEAGDMPSNKAKKFPTDAERAEVIDWLKTLRRTEAEKSAGDPGPVFARRLSNAEYDYTIRDLTGVDLRPTKEFPVDPANQAGFDNTAESLTMSPALVKKYLQAARSVSEHLILKPEGFEFASHPVVADTDRDKWGVLRIVDFYNRHQVDLADYFAAAWRYRHRAEFNRGNVSLADIAAETKLSPKYLATIWAILTDTADEFGPVARLRMMWRELPYYRKGDIRPGAEAMRDYVLSLREKIVPEVKNLTAPQIQNGSQTMVMWKNREMRNNRRTFDRGALYVEGTPLPAEPEKPTVTATSSPPATTATVAPDAYAPATAKPAALDASVQTTVQQVAASAAVQPGAGPTTPNATAANAATPATARPAMAATPRPPQTPDIIQRGGTFLAPAITTTGSSATFKMAAAKKRAADPDLTVPADPSERAKHEAAFARFADVFPDAFFITERARVYLDAEKEQKNAGRLLSAGLHSMTGFFRDDSPLDQLVLSEAERRELDRLWQEFFFAASIPERMHTSFVWFERTDSSYMRDPEFDAFRPEDKSVTSREKVTSLGELYLAKAQRLGASATAQLAIRQHFAIVNDALRQHEAQHRAAEATHLAALEDFAQRAYRRPLETAERAELRRFYQNSREDNGLDHEEAMRDSIARVLMSPHFCYRVDLVEASRGAAASQQPSTAPANTAPLSDNALANRLSYFLWSSAPDAELLACAARGDLQKPEVLAAQARRMLKDARIRNFATEFAGHWLEFRRFEEHNAVDRERFPSFDHDLRTAMYEEPLRFLVDLIQTDRPVSNLLYGDYTFVNAPLAKHYGMPAPAAASTAPDGWVRVERASQFERGGLLPMAVFLTANSPGLRTSPVKRGYWVVRRVLGERIPPPPAAVPDLPSDEKNLGDLTLREVLARHREDKACASCHARFDSFGLVFEGYGPVGERRAQDFGGRAIDARAEFPGGIAGTGLAGLRDYVRAHREADFTDNLARKLLAYGLGRTLLMSDDALIAEMKAKLAQNNQRFGTLVETIVTSPQFRTKRTPANATALKTASVP